jgi:GT2 family glycosyltransferase
MRLPVTACLLSWKRPDNIRLIVDSLHALEFIDEILVWNNNPEIELSCSLPNVRVIQSPKNLGCAARYLCAAQARNDVIYTQDDDALVLDVAQRYESFVADPNRITHGLSQWHYARRADFVYPDGHLAMLGWGAFFLRSWIGLLNELPGAIRESALFRREADKYFTIGLSRQHNTMLGRIRQLPGHSDAQSALWRQPEHAEMSALAVREALRVTRERVRPYLPPRWHVVITCHNYGAYLNECVQSVVRNEVDCLVTIVDDASTDDTPVIAEALADRYGGVSCIRLERRLGPSGATNRGIGSQDSVFVVRLDADDRIGPRYLRQADALLSAGADVANPDAVLFGEQSGTWAVPPTVDLQMMLQRNYVHCAAAFRRSLWGQAGGFDEELAQWLDYDFWIRLVAAGARVRALPGEHFFYRRHAGSLSARGAARNDLQRRLEAKHEALFATARARRRRNAP